jgi:hypothetical protein
MFATGGGGGGGTIVVNADDLRRVSSSAVEVGQAFTALAARFNRPLPEMPPAVHSRVWLELSELSCALNSEPTLLVEVAQELRVRAFWADAADRLLAGYELEGAMLDEFKAGMASGLLLRWATSFEQELARKYFEELRERADPGGFKGFVNDVGGALGDFFTGAWEGVRDPAVMVYQLTPLHGDWTKEWSALGSGIEHSVTHPLEFGRALLSLDALEEEGTAYWLGNLAPSAVAAFFTGGASAGLKSASGTARLAENAEDFVSAARDANRMSRDLPDWLRRVQEGRRFDEERAPFYPHNQVYVDKPGGVDKPDGRGYHVVDSLDLPAGEIISRKFSQLGAVQEDTAKAYLRELADKYPPGTRISPVPSVPDGLAGRRLDGDMILEVPPQALPIPDSVLRYADDLNIRIRDSEGRVYTGVREGE